jgi:hypothetical protein
VGDEVRLGEAAFGVDLLPAFGRFPIMNMFARVVDVERMRAGENRAEAKWFEPVEVTPADLGGRRGVVEAIERRRFAGRQSSP